MIQIGLIFLIFALSFLIFWFEIDGTLGGLLIPLAIDILVLGQISLELELLSKYIEMVLVFIISFSLLALKLFIYTIVEKAHIKKKTSIS